MLDLPLRQTERPVGFGADEIDDLHHRGAVAEGGHGVIDPLLEGPLLRKKQAIG